MNHYIHHIPGRLRIKTPHVKRNTRLAEIIKNVLWPIQGLQTISINTLTGSVVVEYDPTRSNPEEILETLKRACYFDESKAVTHDQVIHTAAASVGLFLGKTVCNAVLGTALEESGFSVIAALI